MSENSNIKFISNIEPVVGDIRFDTSFHHKVHDPKALVELYKKNIQLTWEQHKEYNSCSLPCEKTQEKGDYVFGSFFDDEKNRRLTCKCINDECEFFSDCRGDKDFSDDELIPWLENEDFEALLEYADSFLEKVGKDDKQQDDDELHIEIENGGLVITAEPKKISERKINPYSTVDTIVKLENGIGLDKILPKKTENEDTPEHLSLADKWSVKSLTSEKNDICCCTEKTMKIIKLLKEKEKKKIEVNKKALEQLRQASENGKLKSTGYYNDLNEIKKDISLRGKVNHEYEEMTKKLTVQSKPLSQGIVTYGTKVTIKDTVNGNVYSFDLLGKEDARFLKNYKIIPYTSKLGSAFVGLQKGSQIEISFNKGEEFHLCHVMSIVPSDYLS